jgi:hypothetical protein
MISWFCDYKREQKRREKENKRYENEQYKSQVKRLNGIRNRCNKYLDNVPTRLQHPKRQILVTHEDLVMIWDGANHVQDNL